MGGDPAAIAAAGAQAVNDLDEVWNSFATDLKSKAERTKLEQEIANLKQKIASLQEECQRIQEAKDAGSTLVVLFETGATGPSGIETALTECQEELDKALIELQNKQHELNILNAEYPP